MFLSSFLHPALPLLFLLSFIAFSASIPLSSPQLPLLVPGTLGNDDDQVKHCARECASDFVLCQEMVERGYEGKEENW